MTIQTSFNDITKISVTELEACQSVLVNSGHSLEEIYDYDDGRTYQHWRNDDGNRVIIDVSKAHADNSEGIIAEIIDCWLELRAIRNALEIEEEPVTLKIEQNISAFDQLMANIHECETEMHEDDAFYQLLKRGEVDAAILSFYNLDDEIRQAVLQ